MGRPEKHLSDDDPVARLALRLRALRSSAGSPSYRQLAARCGVSPATLTRAASGNTLPTLTVALAYAAACGGDPDEWKALWRQTQQAVCAARASPARQEPIARQLPPAPALFTGRTRELAALDRHLESGDGSPIVLSAIHGMGGVGKTALALQWARLAREHFHDGELYIDLHGYDPDQGPMDASEALRMCLSALGIAPEHAPTSVQERSALYRRLLSGRRMLVILDNARTSQQVRPLLPGSPTCMALITSRNNLGGLAVRDGMQRLTLDVLTAREARLLLTRAIGSQRATAEPGALAALAELCGHHPLALLIVAERVRATPQCRLASAVAQLSDESERLTALDAEDDDASAVRSVLGWSYRALSRDEGVLFRRLGLHKGTDIGALAAASIAGFTLEYCRGLLQGLVSAHLLEVTAADRYGMHDLVRLLAAELAADEESAEERKAAIARVSTWYVHSASSARTALDPALPRLDLDLPPCDADVMTLTTFPDRAAALGWFECERANLTALCATAESLGLHEIAWQLPTVLYRYFDLTKQYSDWIATHLIAARSAKLVTSDDPLGRILCNLGNAYRPLGLLAQAHECYTQALAVFESTGFRRGQALVLGNMAGVHRQNGEHLKAAQTMSDAIALFDELGDEASVALGLANLGLIHMETGDLTEAAECEKRAMELFELRGDAHGRARALANLGRLNRLAGEADAAIALLTEAKRTLSDLEDRHETAMTCAELADAYAARGDDAGSHASLEEARAILRQIGDDSRRGTLARRLEQYADGPGA
jgi:tetratricopeptide (TPR) repeat protein/transcriptional regulator with XRE-family HTH domain